MVDVGYKSRLYNVFCILLGERFTQFLHLGQSSTDLQIDFEINLLMMRKFHKSCPRLSQKRAEMT